MKILMINVVCGIRSTGRICTDLAIELEKLGHTVKIAYGREKVPEQFKKYAVRIGSDIDVVLHGLRSRLNDESGFGSKKATEKFISWIKKFDPDVIHLHNIHGYYIHIGVLFDYLKKCGKKIIWTLHDCWSFTGHTAYCDSINCQKWIDGCSNCKLKNEYPKSIFDKSSRNWNNKKRIFSEVPNMLIITPSNWLASLVKKSFLNGYSVRVINNGIDTDIFRPVSSDFRYINNLENKKIILGVATAWDSMKGLQDYFKLSEMLSNDYKIVLIGLTKKQIHNIPKSILGIERTANVRQLAEIYSTSDVYLNLSYCENFPTTNLEAISCNTPVITYDVGGSCESASKYGVCVEKGDISELIKKIELVDSFKKIPCDFNKKNTVLNYICLYDEKRL